MRSVALALSTAEATRARGVKVTALAAALADVYAREPQRLPFVARFLVGSLLEVHDPRTLGVGGALVFEAAVAATGMPEAELIARARRSGDLGTAIGEAMTEARASEPPPTPPAPQAAELARATAEQAEAGGLGLGDAEALALELAGTGSRAKKLAALVAAFAACSPTEARFLARAILGEMRVGAKEGIVEDAVAKAFGRSLADVRRAGGLVTDIGALALLAAEDRLAEARVVLGRPLGFMLASPLETARGVDLTVPHAVEDKIDGIRAQAHVSADGVRLFARGKGAVTTAFPDVTRPLAEAARSGALAPAILDGEIVVVAEDGRVRPFSALQPRLRKTEPDAALLADLPVKYLVYDLLHEGETSTLSLPFLERRARLVAWAARAPAPIVLHDSRPLVSPDALDADFDAARARGAEGLVLKRLDAPYAAGVRGFAWLKVKKAFATLDVVIVAAQRGYGKRAAVLSDYTFAVWDGDALVTVGKAYSGLTDEEIRTMTARLQAIAIGEETHGVLRVRPEIVLEVAFDGVQKSDRHASGFALRFPRIALVRDDKTPEKADTLETVRALWEAQLASGHREDVTAKDRKKPKPDRAIAPEKKKGRRSGRRPDIRAKSKQLKLFDD